MTLVLLTLVRPALAQTVVEADGSVNTRVSRAYPSGESDVRLEVSPAIVVQRGSPNLIYRLGYLFSGAISLSGELPLAYSNQLTIAVAALPSTRTALTLEGTLTQGGSAFRTVQRAPDALRPAQTSPLPLDLVVGHLREVLTWEVTRSLRLDQRAEGMLAAVRGELGRPNVMAGAFLGLEWLWPRDALGAGFGSRLTSMRPLAEISAPLVQTVAGSFAASWNHDFDQGWNTRLTMGVERISIVPATTALPAYYVNGSLLVRYAVGGGSAMLSLSRAATPNTEVGAMSMAQEATLRGTYVFDSRLRRQVSAAVGAAQLRPLELAGLASWPGTVLEADVGLSWGINSWLVATVRYHLALQQARADGTPASQQHLLLVGLTGRYSHGGELQPIPSLGGRVDGGDGVRFPGDRLRP